MEQSLGSEMPEGKKAGDVPVAVPVAAGGETVQPNARKASLAALVAKKRETLRHDLAQKQAVEETTTEQWSGLRIIDRCVRQEKWDASMKRKELISFGKLATLRPGANDQVVIGVLCAPIIGPKPGPSGEVCAEFRLTDLDVNGPRMASLILVGRAMDHWAHADGLGRSQCTVGSIFAVLNPRPAKRAGAMLASFETQVLKLGSCPSLRFCDARCKEGLPCRAPYSEKSGQGLCSLHAGLSHGARSRGVVAAAASAMKRKQGCEAASLAPTPRQQRQQQQQPKRPASLLSPVEVPNLGGKRRLSDLVAQTDRVAAGAGTSLKLATALASAAASPGEKLLGQLKEIEGADLDVYTLRHGALYEEVGKLVGRVDAVGAAAKRLRRCWRQVLHDDGRAPAAGL